MRLFCRKNLLMPAVFATALLNLVHAHAEDTWPPVYASSQVEAGLSDLELKKRYALGIGRFDLDAHTEIIGWQLNEVWYFGRQDGLDSGLTLVWQQNANQVSLSKDGLRLTRRF